MAYRRWKPSRTQAREFAEQMDAVRAFCIDHHIDHSLSMDSYYFCLNGQEYRVSNHSVESSNAHAFRDGEQVRDVYHPDGRKSGTIYIHAGKTRIIDIYTALSEGKTLDGRGNVKGE